MIPVRFPEANLLLAMAQDEYEPMEVHLEGNTTERCMTACFRLSDAEIDELVRTRTLWIRQLTFGRGYAPIALSTQKPPLR